MRVARRSAAAEDQLTAIFGALASPVRRAMLDRLAGGVHSVTELAKPFGMAQPTISKHLKVLESAGLVERGKDAQWRPRAINAAPLKAANQFLERYRTLWDERFDRMEQYLAHLQDE